MARKGHGRPANLVNISTYPDDGSSPVGTNEWNANRDTTGIIGFTKTTQAISSNNLNITDSYIEVTNAGDIHTLSAVTTSLSSTYYASDSASSISEGDLIYIVKGSSVGTVNLKNQQGGAGAGKITTLSGSDKVISATVPTILICRTIGSNLEWIEYGGGTANNLDTTNFAAATLVIESEGIGSNDNDTTLPTSAAVKDYVDTQVATEDTIAELNDTTISGIASGELLKWNGSAWINQTLTEAGIVDGNLGTPSALVGTNISGTAANLTAGNATLAATSTALATARTIGGTSFDGTSNIAVALSATATALATARTIGGTSFDGTANITPANITVADTTDTSCSVALFESATGDLPPKSDAGLTYNAGTGILSATGLTLSGDLTVNGTTTTINTSTLTVEDPLINMASGNNAADTVDIGFYGLYDTSGSQDLYAGLFRDANDSGKWKLFKDNQAAPTTTVNTSGTGYATGTLVANIEGNVTGNVTGNASGTALTVTQAAQSAITSVGTLTGLTMGGAINMGGADITNGGVIFLTEQAEAEADVAGKGQIWVDTATPNKLFFTDDAGTDFDLTAGGGATLFHVFSNSTTTTYAGQTGESQTLGTAVGSLASGSGDRDIYIRKIDTNNEGVFAVVHKNGSLVEVQVA